MVQSAQKTWKFSGLWGLGRWWEPAYVTCRADGRILELREEPPSEQGVLEEVEGWALPGAPNAHSHAFQYAMAGTAECLRKGSEADDFWSWREAMYQLALHISPEQMEAIAAMLYAEMLRVGYTSVAEFHYVHHDPTGTPYANRAELGERLVAAAKRVGIRLTLIPIFYQQGGFGQAANERQRRFLSSSWEEYLRLLEASKRAVQAWEGATLGMGVHSLRAVRGEDVLHAFAHADSSLVRHIHVAEQTKEVEACLAATGLRPVSWLLENVELDQRYGLVHATHMDASEIQRLARTEASVILCPSTEGNLGDGVFPLGTFHQAGGRWCIGTDSHVGLSFQEELRWLDYGQRITHRQRNILCAKGGEDSGDEAWRQCLSHGNRMMGQTSTALSPGTFLDVVVWDAKHPLLETASPERRLATLLYALGSEAIVGTMVGGEWKVQQQRHDEVYSLRIDFVRAVGDLRRRLS